MGSLLSSSTSSLLARKGASHNKKKVVFLQIVNCRQSSLKESTLFFDTFMTFFLGPSPGARKASIHSFYTPFVEKERKRGEGTREEREREMKHRTIMTRYPQLAYLWHRRILYTSLPSLLHNREKGALPPLTRLRKTHRREEEEGSIEKVSR